MSIVMVSQFAHSPFEGQLDVIASLSARQIEASIAELKHHDAVTVAMRQMIGMGVSIDDLSDASGLTPAEIRRRVDGELMFHEDIDALAGLY